MGEATVSFFVPLDSGPNLSSLAGHIEYCNSSLMTPELARFAATNIPTRNKRTRTAATRRAVKAVVLR
jgi:hypothetical protein